MSLESFEIPASIIAQILVKILLQSVYLEEECCFLPGNLGTTVFSQKLFLYHNR